MKEEFDRKKALFEDDAAFIQEVREGRSQAVGMDPDQELRILKLRFTAFKRDFKVMSTLPNLPWHLHARPSHLPAWDPVTSFALLPVAARKLHACWTSAFLRMLQATLVRQHV